MSAPTSRTDDLRAFCEVAAAGSFTAAASALGRSTSTVSKQVVALESSLGVRLLNRTTRRVSLTEVGTQFYGRAVEILDNLAEAEAEAGELQDVPRGRLAVTVPMDFGRVHMAPAFCRFAERYPDVTLDIDLSDRQVDLIEERFDVGVRIGRLADSTLVARRLGPSRVVVVASPEYLARKSEPREPRDLVAHDCIGYTLGATNAWKFIDTQVALTPRHRVNNGEMIRALAVAGCGVAMLPTFIVGDDIRAGRLKMLLVDYLESAQGIYVVYPHRRSLPAKVRAFVDQLASYCGPEPIWDEGLF